MENQSFLRLLADRCVMTNRKILLCSVLCLSLAACESFNLPKDTFDFSGGWFGYSEEERLSESLADAGKDLLASGKNAEAVAKYQEAIGHNNANSRAWNGQGAAYVLAGDYEKAKEAFSRALELDPQNPAIANNLAHVYMETGDAGAAVELLTPFAESKDAPEQLMQNFELAKAAKAASQTPVQSKPVIEEKKAPAKAGDKKKSKPGKAAEQKKEKTEPKAVTAPSASVPAAKEEFADLGSFATQGMAEGKAELVRDILKDSKDLLTIKIVPVLKDANGVPAFNVRAYGKTSHDACENLKAASYPCFMSR